MVGWLVGNHRPKRKKEGHLFYYDDAHVDPENHARIIAVCISLVRIN